MNFGGQWIISTWVLNEDINIQKKGKSIGITMNKTRMRKSSLNINGTFIFYFYNSNFLRTCMTPRLNRSTIKKRNTSTAEARPMAKYSKLSLYP